MRSAIWLGLGMLAGALIGTASVAGAASYRTQHASDCELVAMGPTGNDWRRCALTNSFSVASQAHDYHYVNLLYADAASATTAGAGTTIWLRASACRMAHAASSASCTVSSISRYVGAGQPCVAALNVDKTSLVAGGGSNWDYFYVEVVADDNYFCPAIKVNGTRSYWAY